MPKLYCLIFFFSGYMGGLFAVNSAKIYLKPQKKKQWQKANNIWCSQAVTHPSTNQTQPGLTALIGREAVLSG